MPKKVSVIIPVYNVEKYLPTCLESVINQSYTDLEILVVDDGSTDGCSAICDTYAEKDSRIRVIHKENGGLSDARNHGLDIATGDYILLVDSDDLIPVDAVKTMLGIAEKAKADIVTVTSERCDENYMGEDMYQSSDGYSSLSNPVRSHDENKLDQLNNENRKRSPIHCKTWSGENKMREFLVGNIINTTAWGKLYRRSLFNGIRYPYGKYHEDVFTTYRLIDAADTVITSDYCGYIYRYNEASIMQSTFSTKRLDAIDGKLEQAAYIREHYPSLEREANAGIVYACNTCLHRMMRDGFTYRDDDTYDRNITHTRYEASDKRSPHTMENQSETTKTADSWNRTEDPYRWIQKLIRKYGKDYLRSPMSLPGKLMTLPAMASVQLVKPIYKRTAPR